MRPDTTPSAFTNASPQPLPVVPPRPPESLTPISLFADSTAGVPQPKKLSAVYAPFGRLISCETVTTVDSSSMQTPIVGLVTEIVYFGGKLIIPAGTEVHVMAQTDRQRERIAGNTSWTFVWQNCEEMRIKAIALDREFDNSTNQSGCPRRRQGRAACWAFAIRAKRPTSGDCEVERPHWLPATSGVHR